MSKNFDKNNKSDSNQNGPEHSNIELLGQMSMETQAIGGEPRNVRPNNSGHHGLLTNESNEQNNNSEWLQTNNLPQGSDYQESKGNQKMRLPPLFDDRGNQHTDRDPILDENGDGHNQFEQDSTIEARRESGQNSGYNQGIRYDPSVNNSNRNGKRAMVVKDDANPQQDNSQELDQEAVSAMGKDDEQTAGAVINMFDKYQEIAERRRKKEEDEKKKKAEDLKQIPTKQKDGSPFYFKDLGKKFVVYDEASLFCCKGGHKLRRGFVYVICHPYFDNFIITMIFLNSVLLACYNYSDRENETEWNKIIENIGVIFTITFTIECFIKVIAMGFIAHRNSYMRDYFNCLDFLVVLIGIVEFIPFLPGADLKALRTLRVLRPLKSINAFPSMRRLIESLLASLPSLGNAVVFMFFIFILFGILGVQQFKGMTYQRCRTTELPVLNEITGKYVWELSDEERLCSHNKTGLYTCEEGNTCGRVINFKDEPYNLSLDQDDIYNQEFIMFGLINFDIIFRGILTIFQMITLEGWTTIMYNLSDASAPWMAVLFCCLLVVIGSFFLLNVVLAVIMDAFDDVDRLSGHEDAKKEKERKQQMELFKDDISISASEDEAENEEECSHPCEAAEKAKQEEFQRAEEDIDEPPQMIPIKDKEESQSAPNLKEGEMISPKKRKQIVIPDRSKNNVFFYFFWRICTHNAFNVALTGAILINTLLLAFDQYPITKKTQLRLEFFNAILTWIFIAEMFIKIIGLGFKEYANDSFNIFDCTIVVISMVEIVIDLIGIKMGGGGAISALRAIRLLRVFKLARSWTSFRILLEKMVITLKDISNFSVLMFIFMFIYILLGMEIYAYRVKYTDSDLSEPLTDEEAEKVAPKDGFYPRANFNDFASGLITVFIVLIGEDWNSSMYDHVRASGWGGYIFFITLFIFGNLILLNLFLAILLKNFEEPPGKDEEEEEDDDEPKAKVPIGTKIKDCLKAVFCRCCAKKNIDTAVNDESAAQNNAGESFKEHHSISNQNELIPLNQAQLSARDKPEGNLEMIPIQSPEHAEEKPAASHHHHKKLKTAKSEALPESNNIFGGQQAFMSRKKTIKNNNSALIGADAQQFTISSIKKMTEKNKTASKFKEIQLSGKALFLMDQNNWARVKSSVIVGYKHFDNFILFLIVFSTILLTLEHPMMDPNGTRAITLERIDFVVSGIFTIECVLKIIVYGFVVNGKDSYLQNAWNVMDFCIVCLSIISIVMRDVELGIIKVLRMLRVLRPLRMISRNPGLRIAVQSLINAIPDIGNVMVVSVLFLLLFAILGTNMYKGLFYTCLTDNVPDALQDLIIDKFDCMDYGGEWVNKDQNFDGVLASIITLFNVMTTEGWIGVMWDAVDASAIDKVPVVNSSYIQVGFFILFMIFGSLFILNMFVGIVINVFNAEKETLQMNHKLNEMQSDWCEVLIMCYKSQPLVKFSSTGSMFRDKCHEIATYWLFEHFIFGCIVTNTLCLALTWYDEPEYLEGILQPINFAFNIAYTIEAGIKLTAFGTDYFRDGWNKFDITIVMAAWLGMLASKFGLEIGDSTTVIRSFRISRIFKIIKKYKDLRILFNTFIDAFPQLTNVGLLLFLFLFLYSVMGVFAFGEVKIQDALSVHANFQYFGLALLTLFRMATGESWHEIMYDSGRQESIVFECSMSQDFDTMQKSGIQGCGNSLAAYIYFISFMIVVSFIFLNLFIAIILESFNSSQTEEGLQVGQRTIDKFNDIWVKFDERGKGFINVRKFPALLEKILEEEFDQLYDINNEFKSGEIDQDEFQNQIFMFNLHKDEDLLDIASWKQKKVFKLKDDEKSIAEISDSDVSENEYLQEGQLFLKTMKAKKKDDHARKQRNKLHRKDLNNFIRELRIPCYDENIQAKDKKLSKLKSDSKFESSLKKKSTLNQSGFQISADKNVAQNDSGAKESARSNGPSKEFSGNQKENDNFFSYYYYDVLEGLSRNLFQNLIFVMKDELELKDELERQNKCSDDEEEEAEEIKPKEIAPKNDNLKEGEKKEGDDDQDEEEGHDPEKIKAEYTQDIRNGDLSIILSKLEDNGKKWSIYLYKEMVELREQRNDKVHKYLCEWQSDGVSESVIIESSQVAAAYVIRKAMKKWKANKVKKEEEYKTKNMIQNWKDKLAKPKGITPSASKVMPLIKESENEERDSNHGHSQMIQANVGTINEFINNEAIGVHKQQTSQEQDDKQRLMTEEDRASPGGGFTTIRDNTQSRSDRQLNDNYMRSSVGKIDSIPGNKQGEEVAHGAYPPDASSMGYSDAHVLNSVSNQNNPNQIPSRQQVGQSHTSRSSVAEVRISSSEQQFRPSLPNPIEAREDDVVDKESLKDIVSPRSQDSNRSFKQSDSQKEMTMFQKVQREERMNKTGQGKAFSEAVQDVE